MATQLLQTAMGEAWTSKVKAEKAQRKNEYAMGVGAVLTPQDEAMMDDGMPTLMQLNMEVTEEMAEKWEGELRKTIFSNLLAKNYSQLEKITGVSIGTY